MPVARYCAAMWNGYAARHSSVSLYGKSLPPLPPTDTGARILVWLHTRLNEEDGLSVHTQQGCCCCDRAFFWHAASWNRAKKVFYVLLPPPGTALGDATYISPFSHVKEIEINLHASEERGKTIFGFCCRRRESKSNGYLFDSKTAAVSAWRNEQLKRMYCTIQYTAHHVLFSFAP